MNELPFEFQEGESAMTRSTQTNMTTRSHGALVLGALAGVLLAACGSSPNTQNDPRIPVAVAATPTHENFVHPAPVRDPVITNDLSPGRSIRRLSATQLQRSLTLATGEEWTGFEQFAGALGRPDWSQTTEEGLSVSVGVERVWNDAARATCQLAITHDQARGESERVILRYVDLADQTAEDELTNVAYLVRRFHSFDVPEDEADPRLVPWLRLVRAPLPGTSDEFPDTAAERAERWQAVCVGLALHPDFISY